MTPLEIKKAVETYLATNWTRTAIYERNKGQTPPSGSFVCLNFLPGMATALEKLGATDRTGVFMIQIFTPVDVGTDEGFSHGGRLEALFLNKSLSDIAFQAGDMVPRTEPIGIDEEIQKFQHNTIIPFTVITG